MALLGLFPRLRLRFLCPIESRPKAYTSSSDATADWKSMAFNAADAQSHLMGWSLIDDCPVCRYDQRNRDGHESAADTLF